MSESLPLRKSRHLDICLDATSGVETGTTGLDGIRMLHRSIPLIDFDQLDLATEFLGYRLALPVMISCMTGGSEEGRRLNRLLAKVAGERKIAFGIGSIRVMISHPEVADHFALKRFCPDSAFLANIGAAQLSEYPPALLSEALKKIEADGLYVHLNPAQEIFQDGGDVQFSAWKDNLFRLIEILDIPVLIKETGAGIPPAEGLLLLEKGAEYIDVSGAGGTDWVAVESYRDNGGVPAEHGFLNWGYPTGELLWAYRLIRERGGAAGKLIRNRIIASGGLRSPGDFAVSLAAGAYLAAAALPFIRKASIEGAEGVHSYIDAIQKGIQSAVVLTGAGTLDEFRNSRLKAEEPIRYGALILVSEVEITS